METINGDVEYLTIQDAARLANLTEQAIRNAIYRGKVMTVRKYGRILIRRSEFDQYRNGTRRGRPRTHTTATLTNARVAT